MAGQHDYAFNVGRFIHFGLDTDARPGGDAEYAQIVQLYLDQSEFRRLTQSVALGAGLEIVEVGERGIVLVPSEGSLFRMKPAEVRSLAGADDRLLEGFVQVGIAATVYPRAELLDADLSTRRPAITAQEVEELIRRLCARLEEEERGAPDPARSDVEAGLIAGWHVYRRRIPEDGSRRRVGQATLALIEKSLETLAAAGMFVRRVKEGKTSYQPLFRYQVQVVEFSANRAFQLVQNALQPSSVE